MSKAKTSLSQYKKETLSSVKLPKNEQRLRGPASKINPAHKLKKKTLLNKLFGL